MPKVHVCESRILPRVCVHKLEVKNTSCVLGVCVCSDTRPPLKGRALLIFPSASTRVGADGLHASGVHMLAHFSRSETAVINYNEVGLSGANIWR